MESYVKIGADGIDAEAIVKAVCERAAARQRGGEFNKDALIRAERFNLSAVKDSTEFFNRYLASVGAVCQVDINDWQIVETRRGPAALVSKILKKTIWSLLRFYTYHLWSQQNRANTFMHAAIGLVSQRDGEKLDKMQARIDELEKRLAALEGAR